MNARLLFRVLCWAVKKKKIRFIRHQGAGTLKNGGMHHFVCVKLLRSYCEDRFLISIQCSGFHYLFGYTRHLPQSVLNWVFNLIHIVIPTAVVISILKKTS